MKEKLTDRRCETVKVETGRLEIIDIAPKSWNLTLRVTPSSKSWDVRYRVNGSDKKRKTLGTWPSISLKDARAESVRIGGLVQRGIDPVAQEKADQAAKMKLKDLVAEYIDEYCKRHQRSWKQTERIFENWVLPKLGSVGILELDRGRVLEHLHDLEQAGLTTQVNRVLSQIKACLTWAVEQKEYLSINPIATLYKKKKRIKESSRDRILSDDELADIWQAADDLKDPSRAFLKLLMLTGQRRDEVRLMEWAELDLEKGEWLIPAIRTKAKREHLVPLSNTALEIIKSLPKIGKYVLMVQSPDREGKPRTNPYSGQRRLKEIIDRDSKVKDWVLHDLRRTFRTGLSRLGISPDIRPRCVNHAVGSDMDAVYDRHDYVEEKRAAFEAWDRHLMTVVGEADAGNVVALHGDQHG